MSAIYPAERNRNPDGTARILTPQILSLPLRDFAPVFVHDSEERWTVRARDGGLFDADHTGVIGVEMPVPRGAGRDRVSPNPIRVQAGGW